MDDAVLQEAACTFQTPLYVFDESELAGRVDFMRAMLPEGMKLCYAMKANPFVMGILAGHVERIEVCSPGELSICGGLKVDPHALVISGVHKERAAIERAMAAGKDASIYTAESPAQFELLGAAAAKFGVRPRVLMRLTSGNQFGMDAATIRGLVGRNAQTGPLDICGIQYFSGTQKTSLKRVAKELDRVAGFNDELNAEFDLQMTELEYGPGLPVDYYAGDDARAEDRAFLEQFAQALAPFAKRYEVTLEIGRSLTATCGSYLTTVVDAKESGGERFAIVDGGIHQIAYYGGGLSLKNPPMRLIGQREGCGSPEYGAAWTICGSLCTVNDILAKRVKFPIAEGSVLAFDEAGAYCMTEGIATFLSRDLPAIVLRREDGTLLLERDHTPTYPLNSATACV